jgi:hypothetical protein
MQADRGRPRKRRSRMRQPTKATKERQQPGGILRPESGPRQPSPTGRKGPITKLFHGNSPTLRLLRNSSTLRQGTWRRRRNPGARTSARPSPTSSAAAISPSRRSPPGAPTPRRAPEPSPARSSPPRPLLRPPTATKRRTSMRRRKSTGTTSPTSPRPPPSSAAPTRAGGSPARSCSRSGWSTPRPTSPATGPSHPSPHLVQFSTV